MVVNDLIKQMLVCFVQFCSHQAPDGKAPVNPSEISEFPLVAEGGTGGDAPSGMIDVDNDWGFPHPYDNPPSISIMNWYQVTQSSGYNNLLLEINLGAVTQGHHTRAGTCDHRFGLRKEIRSMKVIVKFLSNVAGQF